MKIKLFIFFLFYSIISFSQSSKTYLQTDAFYGNILAHSSSASAFLQGHPTGFFISYNKRTFGEEKWEERFNYPDFGYSFGYQDYHSDILGKLYSVYGHYNFYLFNRKSNNQLIVRAGIGLAYNTNPYNKETNNKNTAFGTYLNSSTYLKMYYQREHLFKNVGVNAGLTFIHASNSNVKSPNSGANVWALSLGVNYNLQSNDSIPKYISSKEDKYFKEPIKLNLAIRGGVNEASIIGSGIKPFFVGSVYLDKRLNRKSAIQFGADMYISPMLKKYYELNLTIPHTNLGEVNSFLRVGIFIGHELFINKLSIETQLGYYAKYPFEYEGRIYETIGLKRYLNNKWFASIRLKAHAANAETVEFGVGIRI